MKQQPRLFLEEIDGTRKFPEINCLGDLGKNAGKYLVHHLFEAFRACGRTFMSKSEEDGLIDTDSFINSDHLLAYLRKTKIPEEIAKLIAITIRDDTYSRTGCAAYKLYKASEGKNYIISGPLTKCLEKMCLEVPEDALPEKFSAYFEPKNLYDSDGSLVKGAFAYVGDITGHRCLVLNLVTTDHVKRDLDEDLGILAFRTFIIPLEKGETLDFLALKYGKRDKRKATFIEKESKDNTLPKELKCLRAIINAILYVTNPNEDFIEQYNEFSKSKKKKETQEKIYSQKPFIKIGYENAEVLKLIVEKETTVRWHFRDQPYGPGRKLRKKILIAPHTRKYKSTLGK